MTQHGTTIQKNVYCISLMNQAAVCFPAKKIIQLHVKRLIDICVSTALLVSLMPVLALVFLVTRLTEQRPVLFKQVRVGMNNKKFVIFKFRSMIQGSDIFTDCSSYTHAFSNDQWHKQNNDPRITPLGKFLRVSSIDELPQLFNVIKGDMSLVGPRPLPPLFIGSSTEFTELRANMRPGITGLWQIRNRADTRLAAMMPHDIEYIRTFSLWLDLKILLRTIPAVFSAKGAR